MKRFKDLAPIITMLLCAVVLGLLFLSGTISLETFAHLADGNIFLTLLIVFGLFALKGFSGTIVYNALIIAVSLLFPLWQALLVNALGTALTLSISYQIGAHTKTQRLDTLLEKHPKIARYFAQTQRYGFTACFAIHMTGLQMEVLGVIFGLLHIGFWPYLVSSWLAIMPGMICFTITGNELSIRSPILWIVLAIDLLLMLFAFLYSKKHLFSPPTEPPNEA